MTYTEFRQKGQEEFNKLPLFFAFSEKQFEEALNKRGLKMEEARDNVYRIGHLGGYYLKKDAPVIRAFFEQDAERDKELRRLMETDEEFCYGAFEYEMYNHEYPINWEGDYEVCSCFGSCKFSEAKYGDDYLRELGFSDKVIQIYDKARRHVQKSMDW